ncbi:PBPRA1643 family SWIM/SEC-C metal-binding motif protein [Dasania marina]|uniref:PBPRA1643 family SWIM/SEC-C metal-binding motif protein n=1 Tax=Dasania marina TaxID=471499 RepID=UPI0030DBD5F6
MSDKFFFKGRQDARQDNGNSGYQTKAKHRPGSKKHPMTLVVTSAARKQEIEAQLAELELHAIITVDSSEDAVESIAELTLELNKASVVKVAKTPSRNDPCSCGSGKKYKKCCG